MIRQAYQESIYQQRILSRILWPLLLYEFQISTITNLERRFSRYPRKWLGLQITLRPDIILVSEATKNVVMLELTVPWE